MHLEKRTGEIQRITNHTGTMYSEKRKGPILRIIVHKETMHSETRTSRFSGMTTGILI